MKNFHLFIIIMYCVGFMATINSCEKADIQKSPTVVEDQSPIVFRSDCEECPGQDECCCGIELDQGDDEAHIRLCGTSDGPDACSGTSICGLISPSGGGYQFDLFDDSNPREGFCMLEGYPFWIYNYSTTDDAYVKITCQGDQANPQIIHIHLGPGERFYYETDPSCELTLCN